MRTPDEILMFCLKDFLWKPNKINWADFNISETDMNEINNLLKTNGQYDTFANLHQGVVTISAHNGPNFLSWHRVFLAVVEEALRKLDRRVSIPYWDSSMDFDMVNPADSIIWSRNFLGNGDGFVTTGPFRNWSTPFGQLRRTVGRFSTLISKEVIASIMTRCRTAEITQPTAEFEFDLEIHHGGPHVWVGGQMSGLNTAAHDPTFFMHHAFIDYIWEMFRNRQTVFCGVNPAQDYPRVTGEHAAWRPMDGLPPYINIDGYRNYWTRLWYVYERSPTCSRSSRFCGSPYLRCDTTRGRCISRSRPTLAPSGSGDEVSNIRSDFGPVFKAPPDDDRPVSNSTADSIVSEAEVMFNSRKSKFDKFAVQMSLLPNVDFSALNSSTMSSQTVFMLSQNLNNRTIERNMKAFIPIRIMYIRAQSSVSSKHDTISKDNLSASQESPYPECRPHSSGKTNITVQSNGINYIGVFSTRVEINTELPASTATTYIRINPPNNGVSKLMLSAFHECGLMCQPTCAIPGIVPVKYRPCSGIFRIHKGDKTVLYGTSVEAAINNDQRTSAQTKLDLGLNPKGKFQCSNADVTAWSQLSYSPVWSK